MFFSQGKGKNKHICHVAIAITLQYGLDGGIRLVQHTNKHVL